METNTKSSESRRELTSHKVNGLNDALKIRVMDDPGPGGANHIYAITFPSGHTRLDPRTRMPVSQEESIDIQFQNGPIQEDGVNGISNEALLAVVEDRLKSFQAGQFACRENACALTKIQEAMMWLHRRTNERTQRGVEGTNKV